MRTLFGRCTKEKAVYCIVPPLQLSITNYTQFGWKKERDREGERRETGRQSGGNAMMDHQQGDVARRRGK